MLSGAKSIDYLNPTIKASGETLALVRLPCTRPKSALMQLSSNRDVPIEETQSN